MPIGLLWWMHRNLVSQWIDHFSLHLATQISFPFLKTNTSFQRKYKINIVDSKIKMVKMLNSCNKVKGNISIFPWNIKYLKRTIIIIKKYWMLQRATKGSNHNQVSREYKISEKKMQSKFKKPTWAIYETNQASTEGSNYSQVSRE